MADLRYRRILLKLSGEALMGDQDYGIDAELVRYIAACLREVTELGVSLAVVVGGGNIFRGVKGVKLGIDRVTGDHMGMLATVINALALASALEVEGAQVRVQTAIEMREVAEPFLVKRAARHLEEQRIVIFGAGTGHPFFSTDTAAALRAAEIGADALLMAKNGVDGVFTADPRTDPNARLLTELSYEQLLDLQVMDATATALARDVSMPIHIFNFAEPRNIARICCGEQIGSVIRRKTNG
ncbi:MAG TPA: UMP kinase [Armatimonadetes bacterium]|nr:UMP kinase [Armatimonadota bacterium]